MKTVTLRTLGYYWPVYLFLLPSLGFILTFSYYPAVSAVYHSFYNWDGANLKTYVGLDNFSRAVRDPVLHHGFKVIGILILANLIKMIPSIAAAVVIHRLTSPRWSYVYRVLFVIPMIIPGMVMLLIWKFFFDPGFGILNDILEATRLLDLLRFIDAQFGWHVFREGVRPAWLAQKELIIPSLILWGFPWVGVVGVLIYLAGLSGINQDVYDAAKLDGVGPVGLFLYIELPLILTQVRINLVLMIIHTLQEYGLVLVILGISGGAGGVGMLPGLYMFRKAFLDQEAGYACAIGLLLFAVILVLTYINQKYVRVEK